MAITATTLSFPVPASGTNFTTIFPASLTGFNNPSLNIGSIPGSGGPAPYNIVQVDMEFMKVVNVNAGTGAVTVERGMNASAVTAHATGAACLVGIPSDFINSFTVGKLFNPILQEFGPENQQGTNLSGSADALTGAAGVFVVKTAGVDAITIPTPTPAMEGNLVYVYSDTAFAHTVTAASACVAAGVALKTIATFAAFAGASICYRAQNLKWVVVTQAGVTLS